MQQRSLSISSLILTLFSASLALACNDSESSEDASEDSPSEVDPGDEPQPNGPGTSMAGSPSESTCPFDTGARQTFLCAGSAYENVQVDSRSLKLTPQVADHACQTTGAGLLRTSVTTPDPGWGFGGHGGMGGGGGSASPDHEWCLDFPDDWFVAGVSFSVGECGESELSLPLKFVEPKEWYRLRPTSVTRPASVAN